MNLIKNQKQIFSEIKKALLDEIDFPIGTQIAPLWNSLNFGKEYTYEGKIQDNVITHETRVSFSQNYKGELEINVDTLCYELYKGENILYNAELKLALIKNMDVIKDVIRRYYTNVNF